MDTSFRRISLLHNRYMHVTSLLVGLTFICILHFYQYLVIVITPTEHPRNLYSYVMWGVAWGMPMLLVALLPASTATDIRYSYNRMTCTFNRVGQVNHDTALLATMATSIGFTCVFGLILTLKVYAAMQEETRLTADAKHISLFGNTPFRQRRVSTVSNASQRKDFKALCVWTLITLSIYLPHFIVVFMATANSGSIEREGEEFSMILLRLLPLTDIVLLAQDRFVRSKTTETLRTLDYRLGFFTLREYIRTRVRARRLARVTRVSPNARDAALKPTNNKDTTKILGAVEEGGIAEVSVT